MGYLYHKNIYVSIRYTVLLGGRGTTWSIMGHRNSLTPKEGAGRSNRLGDANKNKGLQPTTVSPFMFMP